MVENLNTAKDGDGDTTGRRMELAVYGFYNLRPYKPEPAGINYEARCVRDRLLIGEDCSDILSISALKIIKKSNSVNGFCRCDSANSIASNNSNNNNNGQDEILPEDESVFDKEDRAYEKFLKSLDPTKFKEQDHYKILGLSQLRYKATENQVKVAYKKKVLNHHPDKRRQKGQTVKSNEEDYFTCISKAYEILSNPQKRRAYDSVDPLFDEFIPTGTLTYKENFYKLYGPAFERNERWSIIQPCPKLGDNNSIYDDVNKFYNFWYNFESWREFSYLDEEDKEKGENRLERRWIDKQNKVAREKLRKEELKRIRTLVDNSYKNDPRVQKFKEEEKQRKEEEKMQKEQERRAKLEAQEREKREQQEREENERLRLEEEEKQRILTEKREKEQTKKALQKERKALKELCQKYNYFCNSEANDDSPTIIFQRQSDLDKLCQFLTWEKLKSLNSELNRCISNQSSSINSKNSNLAVENSMKIIFQQFLDELNHNLELENQKARENMMTSLSTLSSINRAGQQNSNTNTVWTAEETQLLVKAMTVFPVGTKSRWDVIAAFINEHAKNDNSCSTNSDSVTPGSRKKTGKDVVVKVKEVQKLDEKSKESVAKGLPLLQTKSNIQVETAPSVRTDNPSADSGWFDNPWTAQEQKLLEQALKTYGADDAERWDKVAKCLPGRTKKDCVKRYKELAELVRARKVALQQQQLQQKAKESASKASKTITT